MPGLVACGSVLGWLHCERYHIISIIIIIIVIHSKKCTQFLCSGLTLVWMPNMVVWQEDVLRGKINVPLSCLNH
jgi:hypothetical protein